MVPYLLTLETTSYNALSIKSCRELAEASYLINDASHFEEYTRELILGDTASTVTLAKAMPFLGVHTGKKRREATIASTY